MLALTTLLMLLADEEFGCRCRGSFDVNATRTRPANDTPMKTRFQQYFSCGFDLKTGFSLTIMYKMNEATL